MESQVEKLYENAGCELGCCKNAEYGYEGEEGTWYYCKKEDKECWTYPNGDADCVEKDYPPFTAEKQLELLKICFDKYERLEKVRGLKERCIIYYRFDKNGYTEFVNCETWEETIAGLINNLWQELTDIEKVQIKEILSE